jgi:hypothetical protein
MHNWWLLLGNPKIFKENKSHWLFEKINNLSTLSQHIGFYVTFPWLGIMSWLELLGIGQKLAFFNCPISIASSQEEVNSHWRRIATGQASFASRRLRGILWNHQSSIRSLKKRFPSVIHHHITPLLQIFIGPRVLFFQFCDVAQLVIIHNLFS